MVTLEEMKKAVVHKAFVKCYNSSAKSTFIEQYHYEADEDEEPFILFEPSLAAYQSELEKIEIID